MLTFLTAGLLGLLIAERFSAALIGVVSDARAADALGRLGIQCVDAIPEACYLLALWWIRAALAAIAAGDLYGDAVIRMLDRVGVVLAVGAFAGVFLVPAISRLLGSDVGYWIAYDVSGLVLGAIGVSLKIIADVLRHAAAMKADLDGIF
ncbi:MAG: hypothetical protein ABIR62_13550 [Dokdonella sp.]|uniref:hypothetical protein n=1 Tax=Dokdonella sp. TaxID=2291710 RepID=UPI0032652A5A